MGDKIIEKLFISIGVDAKELPKEIKNVVQNAAQKVKDFFTIPEELSGMVANAYALIALAIGNFVKQTYEEVIALDKLSERLGTSVDRLQMWQEATKDAGIAVAEIGKVWEHLNTQIYEAATKGRGALSQFVQQGVLPSLQTADGKIKDTETYMLELADAFAQMDTKTALLIGRKIGIGDSELMEFFREGSGSINQKLDHIKQLGVYTKEDVKAAKEFDQAVKDLKASLNDLWRILRNSLMPVFRFLMTGAKQLTEGLKFVVQHARVFYPILAGIALLLTKSLIPAIITLGDVIYGLVTKNPKLLAIMAILTAIGLVFEDIMVWIEGGESVIGDFLGDFETFSQNFKETFGHLANFGDDILAALEFFPKALEDLAKTFFKFFGKDGPIAKSVDEAAKAMKQSFWDFVKSVKDWVIELGRDIANAFNFGDKIKSIERNASSMARQYSDSNSYDSSINDYSKHNNVHIGNLQVGSVAEGKQLLGGNLTPAFNTGYDK